MPDGHTLTFSVEANHHAQRGSAEIAQIDSVVVDMAKAVGGKALVVKH
jgi:hypothetical protein